MCHVQVEKRILTCVQIIGSQRTIYVIAPCAGCKENPNMHSDDWHSRELFMLMRHVQVGKRIRWSLTLFSTRVATPGHGAAPTFCPCLLKVGLVFCSLPAVHNISQLVVCKRSTSSLLSHDFQRSLNVVKSLHLFCLSVLPGDSGGDRYYIPGVNDYVQSRLN